MRNGEQAGFAYLGVLVMVMVTSIMAYTIPQNLQARMMREKEATLLFNGNQIAQAIGSYYQSGPIQGCYPTDLAALLEDRREFRTKRHLRQLYPDPMSSSGEWGMKLDIDGRITGVYSLSNDLPYRQQMFPEGYDDFAGKSHYNDWAFIAPTGGQTAASPATCNQ